MTLPIAVACRAMREGRRLFVLYGGFERVVEVHAVGRSGDGREIMRVWQVRGGSASGGSDGWKTLALDDIVSSRIIEEQALVPRPGYRRGDPSMRGGIDCQI